MNRASVRRTSDVPPFTCARPFSTRKVWAMSGSMPRSIAPMHQDRSYKTDMLLPMRFYTFQVFLPTLPRSRFGIFVQHFDPLGGPTDNRTAVDVGQRDTPPLPNWQTSPMETFDRKTRRRNRSFRKGVLVRNTDRTSWNSCTNASVVARHAQRKVTAMQLWMRRRNSVAKVLRPRHAIDVLPLKV